jgi:hypothetical protein
VDPLDGQASFGEGARAVDLPVVLDPDAVEGDPHRGGPELRGGSQHVLPVLAQGERHTGGCQRLELGRADVVGEQPQELGRLRVGGDLMHRISAETKPVLVAEAVRLLQGPGHILDGHRRIVVALSPAVPADRRAAHHLELQEQLLGHAHPSRLPCGSHVPAGSGGHVPASSAFPDRPLDMPVLTLRHPAGLAAALMQAPADRAPQAAIGTRFDRRYREAPATKRSAPRAVIH